MTVEANTEQRIKDAARKVFVSKGFAGARMQDIADEAGINKALLHYYYRSKEKLFEVIFDEVFGVMLTRIQGIISSDLSVHDKINAFVDQYITVIQENPHVPLFVIHELSQDPERFVEKVGAKGQISNVAAFFAQITEEMYAGKIRAYQPIHLMMNILAMCVFPFIAKPMLKTVTGISEEMWQMMMENRREEVKRFIFNALAV